MTTETVPTTNLLTRVDGRLTSLQANKTLQLPTIGIGEPFPPPVDGGLVYNEADGYVYLSNGRDWTASVGAVLDGAYVTMSANAVLPNERVLTAGTGITITDGGAGSTVTVAIVAVAPTTATYVLLAADAALPNARVLTAGTSITLTDGGAGSTITISHPVAPVDATYLTLSTNLTLTNERVITQGTGLTFFDGGAGGTLLITKQSSASNTPAYVLLAADLGELPSSTVLAAGTGITFTDAGAGSTLTISAPAGATSAAQYVVQSLNASLAQERVITAGTNITVTTGSGLTTVALSLPMTTLGDTIYYNGGIQSRTIGAPGTVTRVSGGLPVWGDFIDLSREYFLFDDFYNVGSTLFGDTNWVQTVSGSGAITNVSGFTTTTGNPTGVFSLNSSTSTGVASVAKTFLGLSGGVSAITVEMGCAIFDAMPVVGNDYVFWIGLGNSTSADSTNMVQFGVNRLISATNWVLRAGSASTSVSQADSGVAINTVASAGSASFYRLKFIITASGTSVTYYINDVNVGTINTTLPLWVSGQTVGPLAFYNRTSATAVTRAVYIDYFYLYERLSTTRY